MHLALEDDIEARAHEAEVLQRLLSLLQLRHLQERGDIDDGVVAQSHWSRLRLDEEEVAALVVISRVALLK